MQPKDSTELSIATFAGLVFFATLLRILAPPFMGHPLPFSPTPAILLASGAYFSSNKWLLPCLIALLSVWIGDIFIDRIYLGQWVLFYPGFYWQYGSFLLIALIGTACKHNVTLFKITAASLSSSLVFFIISNFGVWLEGWLYPLTQEGLTLCYIAAIPFFKYEIIGNVGFSILLLGAVKYFKNKLFLLFAPDES